MHELYRYIPVWRRVADGVVLYRCFEALVEGFTVQSKDWFRPDSPATHAPQLERQFVELLAEEDPSVRSGVYPTLEAAIEAFDADFR